LFPQSLLKPHDVTNFNRDSKAAQCTRDDAAAPNFACVLDCACPLALWNSSAPRSPWECNTGQATVPGNRATDKLSQMERRGQTYRQKFSL